MGRWKRKPVDLIAGEEWVVIPRAPQYEASNKGRFREGSNLLPQRVKSNGYLEVSLKESGRWRHFMAHRLVVEAWLTDIPVGMHVNHIDGVKTNNAPHNLEVVTPKQNLAHAYANGLKHRGERHPRAKFTDAEIASIRERLAKGESARSVSESTGMELSYVYTIRDKKRRITSE